MRVRRGLVAKVLLRRSEGASGVGGDVKCV